MSARPDIVEASRRRFLQGATLASGGLRQQEMSEVVVKVPLLRDLPLLGQFFRKTEKETRSTVLTLFITPHIMHEGRDTPPWPQVDLENGHPIDPEDPNQTGDE